MISKQVTSMSRHFDQEEREIDGSRQKRFVTQGSQDFSDEAWLHKILEGSIKERELNIAKTKMELYVTY